MHDAVLQNKIHIIRHCLKQIQIYYQHHHHLIEEDLMRQDAIVLNLQRACEAAIDLALRIIRIKKLDVPQQSRDVFSAIEKEKVIDPLVAEQLRRMVGFRNVAVHDYQKINLEVLRSILDHHLVNFETLIDCTLRWMESSP